jgi:hypothetical protein
VLLAFCILLDTKTTKLDDNDEIVGGIMERSYFGIQT